MEINTGANSTSTKNDGFERLIFNCLNEDYFLLCEVWVLRFATQCLLMPSLEVHELSLKNKRVEAILYLNACPECHESRIFR